MPLEEFVTFGFWGNAGYRGSPNTYMCKWCGTRYCRECMKGDFQGLMKEPTHCKMCNQKRCQGVRVEYVPRPNKEEEDGKNKRSLSSTRGRSAKSSARSSARSKSSKRSKSARSSKSGKKSAGKKKKKKK